LKFLCDNCKAKYQIADEKVAGKTVRMKCRKCGHQIEVRAAVTETSVASQPPPPNAPRPAVRPSGLATSLSATKPRAPSSPGGGALAGAFRSQVSDAPASDLQTASEVGAISVTDEWYVAINGVPVGPVRISELRRKAAAGAVNEDSLCWQEGLEEWRPIRSIPELATLVREAMQGNRPSLISPEPGPRSMTPAPRAATPAPPASPAAPAPPRPSTERPAPLRPAAPARSNVVPIHGRGPTVPSSPSIDIDLAPVTAPLGGNAAAARAPSFTPAPAPAFAPQPTPDPFTFNPVVPTPAPAPAPPPPAAMPSGSYDPFAIAAPAAPTAPTPAAPHVSPLSSTPSIPPGYMPVDQ
jgi:predicted Zn finger-like uncharacterized protein